MAVFVHAVIIGALVVRGREILGRGQGGSRAPGDARVNFFAIPAGAPATVDMALPPHLTLSDLSGLRRIHVELPPLALPQATLPAPTAALGGGGGNAGGAGGGGGRALGRRLGSAWGLERATKRVTFSPPRRGRPMCRPSARFPARWPVIPTA